MGRKYKVEGTTKKKDVCAFLLMDGFKGWGVFGSSCLNDYVVEMNVDFLKARGLGLVPVMAVAC